MKSDHSGEQLSGGDEETIDGAGECGFDRLHVFLHGFEGPADPDLSCRHGGEAGGTQDASAGPQRSGGASRLRLMVLSSANLVAQRFGMDGDRSPVMEEQ